MSVQTVSKLLLKDWHLHRIAILLTVAGVILAVVLVSLPGSGTLNMGVSLALAVLIAVTFVVQARKRDFV